MGKRLKWNFSHVVTMLRNPKIHALSCYYHCRTHGTNAFAASSFSPLNVSVNTYVSSFEEWVNTRADLYKQGLAGPPNPCWWLGHEHCPVPLGCFWPVNLQNRM